MNTTTMSPLKTRKCLKKLSGLSHQAKLLPEQRLLLNTPTSSQRIEKTLDQTFILENEFNKCNLWSKEKMQRLASMLNLTVSKVYKWNWDRRQSNSYQYFKLCNKFSVEQSKKKTTLFNVVKVSSRS